MGMKVFEQTPLPSLKTSLERGWRLCKIHQSLRAGSAAVCLKVSVKHRLDHQALVIDRSFVRIFAPDLKLDVAQPLAAESDD
jgi:hypothetical protein